VSEVVRKARMADTEAIFELIRTFAARGEMLPRSWAYLYEHLREYFVGEQDGQVVACGALHLTWRDLGEIISLAVRPEVQGQGWGARIVQACLEEAVDLGLPRVFVLTYQTDFFASQGFQPIDRNELPQKIWGECIHCEKFDHCDEVALMWEARDKGSYGELTGAMGN